MCEHATEGHELLSLHADCIRGVHVSSETVSDASVASETVLSHDFIIFSLETKRKVLK